MTWLLTLRDPNRPPAAGTFPADANPPDPSAEHGSAEQQQQQPKAVHAYLQSFRDPQEATKLNTVDQPPVYAIIGRGFAATVNRSTLQSEWGRTRIGALQVVHIGYPDPWRRYVSHNMNQDVELLTLPGYKFQEPLDGVPLPPAQRYLDSKHFAKINADQQGLYFSEEVIPSGVTKIEKRDPHYVIHLDDGRTIVAGKIDICTGTGQQTLIKPLAQDPGYGVDMTEELWVEYFDPSPDKRVFAAEMYVLDNIRPVAGGYVCVTGASPAGIQAMEHALCEDRGGGGPVAAGLLVASRTMNDGFPAIGRLDDHAQDADGNPLPVRQGLARGSLFPTRSKVCFAEAYKIESIQPITHDHIAVFGAGEVSEADIGQTLLVTFRTNRGTQRLVDSNRHDLGPLVYGKFHQVVIGSGRTRGGRQDPEKELGSALDLVWDFHRDFDNIPFPDAAGDFPLGLQTGDGAVRILGAAGINNPKFLRGLERNELGLTALGMYERSLPAQARVNGEGVTLAGATIAWANRFYELSHFQIPFRDGGLYLNVNVATLAQLEARLGQMASETTRDISQLARDIYYARHERVGPFMSKHQLAHAAEYFEWARERTRDTEIRHDLHAAAAAREAALWTEQLRFAGRLNDDPWLFLGHRQWGEHTATFAPDFIAEDRDRMDSLMHLLQFLAYRPGTFFNHLNERMMSGDITPPYDYLRRP